MTTIQNHPRFKKDLEDFKNKISTLADENDKSIAEGLLRDLIIHVKKLDSMHTEMAYTHTLSNVGDELRENIRNARIKLDKKLKESAKL